jgi:membrane-bound lytic murein transglycosylase D
VGDTWASRLRDAEDAYRSGLDAYNAHDYGAALAIFQEGLGRIESPITAETSEMDVRRRDLLRTKLSYFLRQARERQEAADALTASAPRLSEPVPDIAPEYPLEMNARVDHQIRFFTGEIPTRLQLHITRSGRYAPLIRKTLKEYGLPQELLYLSMIESGFSPNAYSRSHAVGLWQFIQSTGRLYGLKVDKWVDERRDPQKSTVAAVRHLKDLYTTFGDWNLALAAYNCGESRVQRAIERQGTRDFWKLDLPRQTEEYVPRFIAAVHIARDPESHGLRAIYDPPIETESILVTRSIRLSRIAEACAMSVDEVRALNPSIRRDVTPPHAAGIEVHLPIGKVALLSERLNQIPHEPEPIATLAASGGSHTVRRGETLSAIARRYGTTPQKLAKANRLKVGSIIRAGQRLRIPEDGAIAVAEVPAAKSAPKAPRRSTPTASGTTHTVRRGETIGKIAKLYGVSPGDVLRWNNLSARDRIFPGQKIHVSPLSDSSSKRTKPASGEKSYTVRPGDSLWEIAQRFDTTVEELRGLNRIGQKSVLVAGSKIRIAREGN